MSTGADLEGSSLKWLDEITSQGNATTARTNKVLAASATRMLTELQGVYAKIQDKGKGQYEAQQLYSRLRNLKDLLPPDQQKNLEKSFREDLAKAQATGGKSGTDLAKILGNTSDTLAKTAAPNVPAINAAGKRLGDFWAKENTAFKDRVTALTQTAAAEGKSWRQLSQQVRELLVLERNAGTESDRSRRINQRLGVAGRADLIARTELQTAFVQGQIARYRETGYDWARWSASAERSCPFCIARDGLVYLLEDVESAIPAHPRCRCSLIPAQAPDDFKNKRFEEKGVDAAESLDDAYWAKSRAEKLQQFQRANPKFDDAELRRYARTPTNSQKYLKPGEPAPEPVWAPSGQLIPNLERAIKNAQRAVTRAKAQEEAAKRAEEEAKAADKNKAEEEAKAAEAERKRLEAEAEAAKEAADRLAKEKAELEARQQAERLAATKAKNSEKIRKQKSEYLSDIETAKNNFKITDSDARRAYARAVKDSKYKPGKRNSEEIEDQFLVSKNKYNKEAMKQREKEAADAKKAKDQEAANKAADDANFEFAKAANPKLTREIWNSASPKQKELLAAAGQKKIQDDAKKAAETKTNKRTDAENFEVAKAGFPGLTKAMWDGLSAEKKASFVARGEEPYLKSLEQKKANKEARDKQRAANKDISQIAKDLGLTGAEYMDFVSKVNKYKSRYNLTDSEAILKASAEIAKAAEARKAKDAELELARAQAKAGGISKNFKAEDHVIFGGRSKLKAKDIDQMFDELEKVGGRTATNAKRLKDLINNQQIAISFSDAALNAKTWTAKAEAKLLPAWDNVRKSPQWLRSLDAGKKWYDKYDPSQSEQAERVIKDSSENDRRYYQAKNYQGRKDSAGYTREGANYVVISDHQNFKPATSEKLKGVIDAVKNSVELAAKNGGKNTDSFLTVEDELRKFWTSGKKAGGQGQTDNSWIDTLIHELGHVVHFKGGKTDLEGLKVGRMTQRGINTRGDEFVPSKYGGSNIYENFAENFTAYILAPDALFKASPKTYEWIEKHVLAGLKDY